ncbi:MAG: hypothetical protein GXZ19_13350, partial [Bacteroidales bacterium]|nr:hypothetical protein [Bacteroidales bacterium]
REVKPDGADGTADHVGEQVAATLYSEASVRVKSCGGFFYFRYCFIGLFRTSFLLPGCGREIRLDGTIPFRQKILRYAWQ